jgi:hypothetical protein
MAMNPNDLIAIFNEWTAAARRDDIVIFDQVTQEYVSLDAVEIMELEDPDTKEKSVKVVFNP